METRNVKLSLEKAKEWYKQGGDLKEIALQAYSEDELTPRSLVADSWEEVADGRRGWYVGAAGSVHWAVTGTSSDKSHFPTKELVEASLAMSQLAMLMYDAWDRYGGWRPDWQSGNPKYCIYFYQGVLTYCDSIHISYFLSFPTAEIRDEFLEKHRALIEQAKPLL